MPMRGRSNQKKREITTLSIRQFSWDRAVVATAAHSTLPWFGLPFAAELTLPLQPLRGLTPGSRDRLSLMAQFAGHVAFLQFAGIPDGDVVPSEWAVIQKRGADCRLVRVAAAPPQSYVTPPPLTLVQQFAELIGLDELDVLEQSWARAEAVFCEAARRLRASAVADLQWSAAAAEGQVSAPGPEALRRIWLSRGEHFHGITSFVAMEAMAALDPGVKLISLSGGSLLTPLAGLESLAALIGKTAGLSESELVDRCAEQLAAGRHIFTVGPRRQFDPLSWRVIERLSKYSAASWVFADGEPSLPDARTFRIASALPSAHPALATLAEPARSYIGALALLGNAVSADLASRFLARFFYEQELDALVIEGTTWLRDGKFGFTTDAHRDAALELIPTASRTALCRIAAEVADPPQAVALLIEAGDFRAAVEELEKCDDEQWLAAVARAPRSFFAGEKTAAARYATLLVEAGRYLDATEIAPFLDQEAADLLLARCERRRGDYKPALARLERLSGAEADLLRAEVLSVIGRADEARDLLRACVPGDANQQASLGYASALLALERGERPDESWRDFDVPRARYLSARYATYRDPSIANAEAALQEARTAVERADALLDRVYVLFSAGRWAEARQEAVGGLAAVDETQGDRAAGAFLFFLSFLAADDGQWVHAAQWIARLRHFYGVHDDALRLAELDLLSAHLEFSSGHFELARRAAAKVSGRPLHGQIVEAAALILDELDWMEGSAQPLRSTGQSGNLELDDRHRLMLARRGGSVTLQVEFHRSLRDWESGTAPRPSAGNRSEQLKLFRSALARALPEAGELAAELGIDLRARPGATGELQLLRAAATATFPFTADDFGGANWRLASRNRLEHWNQSGSASPLQAAELDAIAADPPSDWLTLSDRELFFLEGCSMWSVEARQALSSIVALKVENHRLRRMVEQDDLSREQPQNAAVEGIIGNSAPMRELNNRMALVARRDVAVCINGESGTGKELVANAIHRLSPRRGRMFMAINCAALPDALIESELFGHVRGAFTGADRDRVGVIESAEGGTLFLDEIGEMPLAAQAKLLRFLQEGEFRRVGDTVNRTADVRIVSATNRELDGAVSDGRFRADLYYRICGVMLELPPLRDRGADILMLAMHFLTAERARHRSGASSFSQEVEGLFRAYRWPGNVRELQNTVRAAHAMAGEARAIDLEHLPERLRNAAGTRSRRSSSYQDEVARFRRELIERSLVQANGNQNQAAVSLNMSRQALAYQIRELGILASGRTQRTRVAEE